MDTNPVVLISLQRDSDGLFAWTCAAPNADSAAPFRRIALAELPLAQCPQRDVMLADWQSVGAARELGAVWPAFWRLFWHTLSGARDTTPLAAMPLRVAPAAPRATAAHPRAYRGTKYQPPKPPAQVLDFHIWLGDDRLLDGFFSRHDFVRLPALDAQGRPFSIPCDAGQAPTVARLLAWRAGAGARQWPALPEKFRIAFLWQLRTRPPQDLLAWFQVWRGLDSPDQGPELALAARLCALDPGAHGWAGLALNLAPSRHAIFMNAVLAQHAYLGPCAALGASALTSLDADTPDDARFACYLGAVLSNLNRQVSVAYSLCGCALANRVTDPYRIERLGSDLLAEKDWAPVPMGDIDRMSNAVGADARFWELSVWRNCGILPGFDMVLRDTCWERLGADVAYQWLMLFDQAKREELDDHANAKRWRDYLALFPAWHRALVALSGAWQGKFVRLLRDFAGTWDDAGDFRASAACLLPVLKRLCHPPFSASIDLGWVASSMASHIGAEGCRQLAASDERTWLAIERACRRDNDAILIGRGLESLSRRWPAFLLQTFAAAPARLMRTARLLGCLAYERQRQFLSETSRTVWFATNWAALDPYEACSTLYRLCIAAGLNSPVPRRLREHIEGRTVLTDGQIARHCRVSLARLPIVLLAAIEHHVWRSIDTPFKLHTRSTAASHAIRMLAGLEAIDNRKALRRFLLAYSQDRAHACLDHPLNRAWFARHPRIDAGMWAKDPLSSPVEGTRDIALARETDPLEILMLGTYVGSCLGIGGLCNYSAVACLLDANKQVVYARDGAGRVLARQLLAIDERDRLICFAVYPVTANAVLLNAFAAFDVALARALGIEMYSPQDDGAYDIPIVLAKYWWDDGVWDDERIAPARATTAPPPPQTRAGDPHSPAPAA